jgi:hypothetical protein
MNTTRQETLMQRWHVVRVQLKVEEFCQCEGRNAVSTTCLVIAKAVRSVAIQWAQSALAGALEKPLAYGPRNDEVEGKRMGFSSTFNRALPDEARPRSLP